MLAVAALLAAAPAFAQFGSIFRDDAAASAGRRAERPAVNFPQPPATISPAVRPRPPSDLRSDQPPAQPLPAPMNLPPSSRPGAGAIESAPLAPLPGGAGGAAAAARKNSRSRVRAPLRASLAGPAAGRAAAARRASSRAIPRRSPATRSWWSRRRNASPIRPRCSPASTRSPAASSRSTSRSTRPCSSARCR